MVFFLCLLSFSLQLFWAPLKRQWNGSSVMQAFFLCQSACCTQPQCWWSWKALSIKRLELALWIFPLRHPTHTAHREGGRDDGWKEKVRTRERDMPIVHDRRPHLHPSTQCWAQPTPWVRESGDLFVLPLVLIFMRDAFLMSRCAD